MLAHIFVSIMTVMSKYIIILVQFPIRWYRLQIVPVTYSS